MKHSNKGLLVLVLAIVVSFAASQAFGDGPKGPKGPKFEPEFRIVKGCVLRIHDDAIVGITLCTHPDIVDYPVDCSQCDMVEDEDEILETILGIGPPHYWDNPCIANIDEDGNIIIDEETGSICIADGPVTVPDIGDFVTIKAYDVLCSEDIAFWAQTEELAPNNVVLLRDPDTLKSLWKGLGNKKKK